jgi:hypothetical protein
MRRSERSIPTEEVHMNELIEAIRVAVADGATAEQKAIGAQACRTIIAALGAEPGKPIVLPGVPKPHPLSTLSVDQALDLVIARLRTVADAREQVDQQKPASAPRGPQISMVTPPAPRPPRKPTPRK